MNMLKLTNKYTVTALAVIGLLGSTAISAEPAETPTGSTGALAKSLGDSLVHFENGELVNISTVEALDGKKLIAVYYSAHWCPPCRAFTPSLVDFYKETTAAHPEFELIFVSSDRSEDAMAEYMEWGKMPFLAVDFDKVRKSPLRKHSARGIPYMVVLDADGKVVLEKPAGQDWIHPGQLLPLIEEELKKI